MKSNNIIEINGRKYDAKTGLPLDGKTKKQIQTAVVAAGKFIDGYRPQIDVKQTAKKVQEVATKKLTPQDIRATANKMHLSAKRSLTLNRAAVKKPSTPVKDPKKSEVTKSAPAIRKTDDTRLSRVAAITKSSAISRFNSPVKMKSLDIRQPQPAKAAKPTRISADESAAAAPTSTIPASTRIKSAPIQTPQASAQHKKAKHHKPPHIGRYLSSAAVIALLAGYVAYLNIPGISMKVAAHQAGFAATMPGYRPSGYSLSGPIAYSSGQVTVNFRSNTDDRHFSLVQQPSTWDSTALAENYVAKKSQNYLTYQDRGLTIYIYNGSSAAWVNAGKLYNVEGKNSELDADQILKFATSV